MSLLLSKSKIKMGFNCEKALYLSVKKAYLAKYSQDSKKRFALGNEIGEASKKLFPLGFEVKAFKNLDKLKITQHNLAKHPVIFEASFEYNQLFAQADILQRHADGTHTFIEVKSGLSEKPDYIEDVAVQFYILSKCLNLKDFKLWIVNKNFSGDLKDLFTELDVSQKIQPYLELLEKKLPEFLLMLKSTTEPQREIGPHCSNPYDCPFKDYCWDKIPKSNSIFQIPNFAQRWEAYNQGIISLDDPRLVSEYNLNPNFLQAIKDKQLWVNSEGISSWKQKLTYPLASLEILALPTVLPKFPNSQVYQPIPFSFSLNTESGSQDFLHPDGSDPRKNFLDALLEYLPQGGSILTYDLGLAKNVLFDLRRQFPEKGGEVLNVINRLVDLAGPTKEFLYHPNFVKDLSLKRAEEVFAPQTPQPLPEEFQEPGDAFNAFQQLINSDNLIEKLTVGGKIRQFAQKNAAAVLRIAAILESYGKS